MQKNNTLIGVFCASLLTILLFSGCTQQQTNHKDQQDDTIVNEMISSMLNKTKTIDELYYELVSSTSTAEGIAQTTSMKVWEKGPFLKEEGNITATILKNATSFNIIRQPLGTYYYNETKLTYVLSLHIALPQPSMSEIIQDLMNNQTLKYLGIGSIDGKNATIIEYTTGLPQYPTTVKLWIWNETGLLLKSTTTTTIVQTTEITKTYTNYSFVVSDDVFNVEYCDDC